MKFDFTKRYKNELLYRWIGIVVLSLLLSSSFVPAPFRWIEYSIYFGLAFIQTTLFWHGTQYLCNLLSRIIPMLKNIILTLILYYVVIGIFVFSMVEIFENLFLYLKFTYHFNIQELEFRNNLLISLFITFFITSLYLAAYFFNEWRENKSKAEQFERLTLEARFETLKSQINPHFLFNSLNTLLALVVDNPVASQYVESLSSFMRYLLENKHKEVVLLEDELKMTQQYIYIQKGRFGEKLVVNFDVPEPFLHFAIPPLSLQILVENAIKHNVISQNKPLEISVFVEDLEKLVIENNIQPKLDTEPSTGIGLENIRSRYLYLTGKEIEIQKNNLKFIVKLPLFEASL